MKRCLLWGTGIAFKNNIQLIQYYEQSGKIEVVGITSNDSFYDSILGYSFIDKSKISEIEFDVLIIMTERYVFPEIRKEAISKGVSEEKIVPLFVMTLPGFDFDKYACIKRNPPTIFTSNCWGGVTYSSLGLEFKSPLINLCLDHKDYIKFLKNPKYYLDCPLELEQMKRVEGTDIEYPIIRIGDTLWHFNHYSSFEEAQSCWNRRKERINWDNLIVMFYDENDDLIDEFCKLPYEKKICFVPYASDKKYHIGIDYRKKGCNKPFWEIVMGTASGLNLYYDVFDLILYNKVTPIAEI